MDLGKVANPLISRICRAGHAQRMAMNTVRTKSSSGLTRDRPERSESSVVGLITSSLGQVPRNRLRDVWSCPEVNGCNELVLGHARGLHRLQSIQFSQYFLPSLCS